MNSIKKESLKKLSRSELKKQAKKNGIKDSMTPSQIIASLMERSNADEDSFVTLERTIMNSCKKNKETLFDRDSQIMSETPRRDTYIVKTPVSSMKALNASVVMASASPELKQAKDDSLYITLSRGSEKKSRKSKRKVSFVTPRRSTRLSVAATPQYNSVKGRPKTPMPSRLSSTKPVSVTEEKDPIVCDLNLDVSDNLDTEQSSRDPHDVNKECFELNPKVILHRLKEEDLKDIINATEDKVKATPMQSSKKVAALTPGFKKMVTPLPASNRSVCATARNLGKTPLPKSTSKSNVLTPGFKKATPMSSSKNPNTPRSLKKLALTPGLTSSVARRSPRSNVKPTVATLTSSNVKKTPNFSKLHQKAFEKMESLSDYHQRKLLNSEKKKKEQNKNANLMKSNAVKQKRTSLEKIRKASKVFGGVPFIPSAANTKPLGRIVKRLGPKAVPSEQSKATNEKIMAKKTVASNVKAIKFASRENTPLKRKQKFDLRASLARKLPYKPHSGPLKPLNGINLNNTFAKTQLPPAQKVDTKNEVVTKSRNKAREVVDSVRKNKRFVLQMNNRNLNMRTQ